MKNPLETWEIQRKEGLAVCLVVITFKKFGLHFENNSQINCLIDLKTIENIKTIPKNITLLYCTGYFQ